MNDPHKESLTDFIQRRLPDLLGANGGKMLKETARQEIHQEFADTQSGWPASLDEKDGAGPRWANAWGHALRRLSRSQITELCSHKFGTQPDYSRLKGVL